MEVFPLITISLTAVFSRFITKTWIAPGAFFSFCWAFFIIIPIIFSPNYAIDHLGIWFITIFCMALSAGSIMAYLPSNYFSQYPETITKKSNNKFLFYVYSILLSISFFGIYLLLKHASNLYSFNNYNNNWLAIPNLIAVDRYGGMLNYPFIIKYSLYFIYPSNLMGGLLLGLNGTSLRMKFFSTIPIFAAILLGIIEGARTSILLGIILFFSSWLSTLMLNNKLTIRNRSSLKILFLSALFILLFTGFFILIQWLRQGMDTIIVELLIERINAYFFGYLSAFSLWIGSNSDSINYNIGWITFAGINNLIGIMERPLGFYDPIFISDGISTNIFTAYRGIVIDFSIPGSIVIAFLIGFITQSFFQNKNRLTIIRTIPISMFYAFTLYSPLISIFHYNSILFSWLVLLIPLILSKNEFVANHR